MPQQVTINGQAVSVQPSNINRLSPEEASQIERIRHLAQNIDQIPPIEGAPIKGAGELSANDQAAVKTAVAAVSVLFPDVAAFALRVGLQREEIYHKQLHRHAEEASEIEQTIEKLVDLSGKFAVHGDKDEIVISEEVKALCKDLQEKGIEILHKDEGKATRERLAELKSLIGSHNDRLKTQLQKKFTTEIQVKINELNSLLECLKTIEKYATRLTQTLIGNQRGR